MAYGFIISYNNFRNHKTSKFGLVTIFTTLPNSEIICVQNVGAKVEIVSYLKK